MYKRWLNLLIAFVFVFVFPASILVRISGNNKSKTDQVNTTPEAAVTHAPEETLLSGNESLQVSVLQDDGNVTYMDLEEYIFCVVLAEMPASFETEALKAQAVVARTYTLRRIDGNEKHPQASVCKKSSCCQSFCSEDNYMKDGGLGTDIEKVRAAVDATKGFVLVYEEELIEATYFSCSGGITEDAAAVWGTDVPYLKSTLSPGEEYATNYVDTVYFTAEEFENRLNSGLDGSPQAWIGRITYTAGMGVDTMEICGKEYDGTELRSLLGLRSTAFTITTIGSTVVVTTKGHGHRVGMSQYGADAMAVNGSNYQQILAHYYQGTELVEFNDK